MLTLTSAMARTARLFAERTAIVDPEGSFTWRQFTDRAFRAARVLGDLGIRRGDRYGIIARNGFRNAEIMHAGYWMGAVPVPVNFRLAPPEIAYILEDADCRLLIAEDVFAGLLATGELASWADRILAIGDGAMPGAPVPRYEAMLSAASADAPAADVAEEDDALLVYTGGTTGRPKGVRLSHRNILSNAMQIGLAVSARPDDVFLHVAPMFHSADLLAEPWTLAGGAHYYLPKFTATAVFEAIETYRVTSSMLTPTMIIVMLQDPELDRFDLSSLRQVIYGSAPMAAEWIRKAVERFEGVEFIQAYGLTETAPLLTMLPMADHVKAMTSGPEELLKSVGQPLVGVDLRIVDRDDRPVTEGEAGEIVVRGPNVATGYLNRPDATAEAFREGWFHTGDIGRLDAQGHLFLLDRVKDMIITGSEIVYSLEVEAALYENPKVSECAVVGIPDEVYGEALLAAVVPAPGETPTAEELIEHCRARIGGFKIPRRYVFLDELPKSAMNKVLKNELRRIYGKAGAAESKKKETEKAGDGH